MNDAPQAGSLHLSDDDFLLAIEACSLPSGSFGHGDHIRLARLYIVRLGVEAASDAVAAAIRHYAESLGAATKYHETITRAWFALVAGAMAGSPESAGFADFAAASPGLFDKAAVARFYSPDLLASERARREFVEPDRDPLPWPGVRFASTCPGT